MEKQRKMKILILSLVIILVMGLTVAFAAMTQTLNINGRASTEQINWNIHFVNISDAQIKGKASVIENPVIEENGAAINNMKVRLKEPGDEVIYTVDLVNDGNIDAKIDEIKLSELTEEQAKIFSFDAKYTEADEEGNTEIGKDDTLEAQATRNITITIKYKDIEDASLLPEEEKTLDKLSLEIIYVQDNNKNTQSETTPKVEDEYPGDITDGGTFDGSSLNPYQISSVEDLVYLGQTVDAGTNYSGKYITLNNNLDINSKSSYIDKNTTYFGDINEDGITEGLMKELTTEKGFNPIGDSSNVFKGTLDGNNNTISNLTMNREEESHVGLFGNINGTVQNLKIENFSINGMNNVGALAGYTSGTINNVEVKKSTTSGNTYVGGIVGTLSSKMTNIVGNDINVTGNTYVGGLFGMTTRGKTINRVKSSLVKVKGIENVGGLAGHTDSITLNNAEIINGNVEGESSVGGLVGNVYAYDPTYIKAVTVSSDVKGTTNVGGIVGLSSTRFTTNLQRTYMKSGTITGTTNVHRILGSGSCDIGSYSSPDVTINGERIVSGDITNLNGADLTYNDLIKNINLAELVYDTYIGGDNDSDGYYYDYDSTGTLVEKNINTEPILFTLSGSGTSADPYIINTKEELKQATSKLSGYYKLNADLDLTGYENYVFGSYNNPFKGTFDGNNHKISNLTMDIDELTDIGLFGNVNGTVQNLKIENFSINGMNNVGALAGYTSGTINNVEVKKSTTSGNTYVGGIVGTLSSKMTNIVGNDINVTGNTYVGGLFGMTTRGKTINRVKSSLVKVKGIENVGGLAGHTDSITLNNAEIINGNVEGESSVGGLVGNVYAYDPTYIKAVTVSSDVKGTTNVGGIVGLSSTRFTTNLQRTYMKSGTITGTTNVHRILGSGSCDIGSYSSPDVTINGERIVSELNTSLDGADLSLENATQSVFESLGFSFVESTTDPYWIFNNGDIKLQ